MNRDKEKTIQALKERAKEMLNNDYSRKIGDEGIYTIICEWERTLSELETYKKIAEKLAELLLKGDEILYICDLIIDEHCNKYKCGECVDCIIDWARNEVEKDD